MNRERVENSPGIETDKPVSRQHETDYYDYYGYPYYWTGPYLWGPFYYPAAYPGYGAAGPSAVEKEIAAARHQQTDVHLRSTKEITDYYIEASDGDIGHVVCERGFAGIDNALVCRGWIWCFIHGPDYFFCAYSWTIFIRLFRRAGGESEGILYPYFS